jgi:hypothetical protein
VVIQRGQIRRIGWVIKTLEAHVNQFLRVASARSAVSFLVGLRTYQHPRIMKSEVFLFFRVIDTTLNAVASTARRVSHFITINYCRSSQSLFRTNCFPCQHAQRRFFSRYRIPQRRTLLYQHTFQSNANHNDSPLSSESLNVFLTFPVLTKFNCNSSLPSLVSVRGNQGMYM